MCLDLSLLLLCGHDLLLFLFASPKRKSNKKKKATFFESLRAKKGALRCCLQLYGASWRWFFCLWLAVIAGLVKVVAVGFIFELWGLHLRRKKAPSWAGRQRTLSQKSKVKS